jgi:hypothetical protein
LPEPFSGRGFEMRESVLRTTEIVIILISCYMASITFIKTTLYNHAVTWIGERIFKESPPFMNYLDIVIIAASLSLCAYYWKKGEELSYARIFSINMLLFFPAILDFSYFNWIGLIFGLVPNPEVPSIWVFGVGLLVQMTYIWLRCTLRFRSKRGATEEDIDGVTGGQVKYLSIIALAAGISSCLIYLSVPYIQRYITSLTTILPYPHITIGIITAILLSVSTIYYLRGSSRQKSMEEPFS